MHELARFECFNEKVVLSRNDDGTSFKVEADWRDGKRGLNRIDIGLSHRDALVLYGEMVNLSLCRLTLSNFYEKLGQQMPRGDGKYGLPT